jgi:DNA mismatch repair protein MutS
MSDTQLNLLSVSTLTPMVRQYQDIKKNYQDCLLLFRLGDFYELFFEDAIRAAAALDITLTKRGEDMPMCGIPFHAADNYIARLIKQGFKVAICEQLETPEEAKKRGHKSIVKRDVVRLITAGTLTEDALLEAKQNNFLVALSSRKNSIGLAVVDISTREFFLESVSLETLEGALARLAPKEILLSQEMIKNPNFFECLNFYKTILTPQVESRFDLENGRRRLEAFFHVASLEVFGAFSDLEVKAAGAVLDYISLTQRGGTLPLQPPTKLIARNFLQIDPATQRNLELYVTLNGQRKGSFLSAIDRTLTAGGARALARTLAFPMTNVAAINDRLNQVSWFVDNLSATKEVRKILEKAPDGERVFSRLSLDRGGPRDLLAIKSLMETAREVVFLFQSHETGPLGEILGSIKIPEGFLDKLSRALEETAPVLAREGGVIKSGYLSELDTLRQLRDDSRQTMAALQMRYVQETGISSLKIKYNNILGYYIEVTTSHKDRIPDTFIHRQTLINGMRFTTPELVEIQEKLNTAAEKALALELSLFKEFVQETVLYGTDLTFLAQTIALLDVLSSLAILAVSENYCRPVVDESLDFTLKGARHPVVESMLKNQGCSFVPNNISLTRDKYLWLLTGPNMAGKSTYLRQNALLIILAQMGSYVPAMEAHIGVVDRIFSRVGAADDLARGRSTFMVEMVETATILNQATNRSFVILDELGRGTSTYDGMSLAWATAEFLHTENKSRGLFATHYHELTSLEKSLEHLACYTVQIKEWEGKVVFLHQVVPGCADQSYGIHVAALAGLPKPVIHRAQQILESLENKRPSPKDVTLISITPVQNPVVDSLKDLDPDALTPREALDFLYTLKRLNEA